MALFFVGAFTTGFATGWLVRSFTNSTRGALVGLVVAAQRAGHGLSRIAGQISEWAEDVIAEGKAQYERTRVHQERKPPPEDAPAEG